MSRTLGMESPAAHFSQFVPELSETHLDVAQPALNGSRPLEEERLWRLKVVR
jgi:hypothetical protein